MKMVLLSLLSLCLMIAPWWCHSGEPEKPEFSCASELTCQPPEELIESALNGSANAALEMSWSLLDKGDKNGALYWAQIAMENGSDVGRRNYAFLLSERGDAGSLIRARYHLKILVDKGYAGADLILESVERKLDSAP